MKNNYLKCVREYIVQNKLDGFIFFKRDPFGGEFCFEKTDAIRNVSNFTGSYAVLLVTRYDVHIFTDPRYEIRVKNEVNEDTNISLENYKAEISKLQNVVQVGFDPMFAIESDITGFAEHIRFNAVPNFINSIFGCADFSYISTFKDEYGDDVDKKLKKVIEHISKSNLDVYLFGSESLSWVFNERSNAIKNYPISVGFVMLFSDGTFRKFYPDNILNGQFEKYIKKINGLKIGLDAKFIPYQIVELISKNNSVHKIKDIIMSLKIIKTDTEILNMKTAHIRESLMWLRLIDWIKNCNHELSELDISLKILELKKCRKNFFDESFDSIVANSVNAASIHYSLENKNDKIDFMVLIDTGTQYLDGTTDVTRCITLSDVKIPEYAKYYYTMVLKSHISFASLVYPRGTTGSELNAMARSALWNKHLDFKHGFGHGIGCFLNVHEPYISIGTKSSTVLYPGMIMSNEPGVYIENKIGSRIENAVLVEEDNDSNFFKFTTIDYIPFDDRLIDVDLLTDGEIKWINDYYELSKIILSRYADKNEIKLIEKYFIKISR